MANESFELEFERKGAVLPVTAFQPGEGMILQGETDAWPLGFAFQFAPLSAGTKAQFERIQRQEGWSPHEFHLRPSQRDGRLRLEGIRPKLLPPGDYRLAVQVSGYRFHHQIHEFHLPEKQNVIVGVPEKPEKRTVVMEELSAFDDFTRRIVQDSTIDNLPMAAWLADPLRRNSRKACALNILAKLRTPIAGNEPLSEGVVRVLFADVDRIYLELTPNFADRVFPTGSGFEEDSVVHTTHLKLFRRIPGGPYHPLDSVRERVERTSLQIALARPQDPGAPQFADVDIDLGNPFVSPIGFFTHVGELIDPGKTDHLSLFDKLKDSPSSDFLYYTVRPP